MRIIFQGSATPQQIGKAIEEILKNTLEKAEVKGKKRPIHNAVVEFNLNLAGEDQPMLLIDDAKGTMLTIHTGIEKGELTDYVEVDRSELVDKFNELVENATATESSRDEIAEAEFSEIKE